MLNKSKNHDAMLELFIKCLKDTDGELDPETLREIIDQTYDGPMSQRFLEVDPKASIHK